MGDVVADKNDGPRQQGCQRRDEKEHETTRTIRRKVSKDDLLLETESELLEGAFENQLNNQKQFSEASNVLKSDFQHREAALRQDVTESEERARLVGVELDRLRRELHVKAEELAKERNEKISEIQRLTNSYEQAMESVTTSAAHLHKLKLENIEKDVRLSFALIDPL